MPRTLACGGRNMHNMIPAAGQSPMENEGPFRWTAADGSVLDM
jgi:hypothetical protein